MFYLVLAKVAKLYFLENTLKCLETGQKSYPYNHPERNNGPWKFGNILRVHGHFFMGILFLSSNTDFNITQKYSKRLFSSEKLNYVSSN